MFDAYFPPLTTYILEMYSLPKYWFLKLHLCIPLILNLKSMLDLHHEHDLLILIVLNPNLKY